MAKVVQQSSFSSRSCIYKTWPLLQTQQSQSSSTSWGEPTSQPQQRINVVFVCAKYMCVYCSVFLCSCRFACLCSFFKVYLCLTYTSITDWLKRHKGFNLATFTEQLMCSAQVRSADSALYLKPNTSLCFYYSFIPNISLSLFSPFSFTGSSLILDREHFHANDVTSSIPNHPVCHRSILIPLYPLVRHTRSLALNSLAPSLSSSNIPQSLLCLVFLCY